MRKIGKFEQNLSNIVAHGSDKTLLLMIRVVGSGGT